MYRKTVRNICVILLAIILTMTSVGCSDKKKDVSDDIQNLNGDSLAEGGLKEKLGITEEHVSYQIGSTGISVDGDIIVPDAASAGIYEMEPLELTPEYMKQVADKLFDDSEYTVYYPPEVYPLEERQKMLSDFERECVNENSEAYESYIQWIRYIDFSRLADSKDTKYVQNNLGNDFAFYEIGEGFYSYAGNLGGTYFAEYNEISSYVYAEGKVDGKSCKLSFMRGITSDDESAGSGAMAICMDRNVFWYYMVEELNSLHLSMYGTPGIPYTDEELENLIHDYVSSLGFEDFRIYKKFLLRSSDSRERVKIEDSSVGYCYLLTRVKGNVQTNYIDYQPGQEIIKVYVTAEGIAMCEILWPYKMGDEKAGDTTLMKWEQIDEIFQNQVIADYQSTGKKYNKECNHIEFEYKLTAIDKHMVLIPVWIYSNIDEYMNRKEEIMIINAVDGTIIEDWLIAY